MFRRGDWIQTFTGKRFYPCDPRPEEVDPVDICHALACVSRFTGHTREPYSVAQHSVMVSKLCDEEDRLWGLLHDASEAYIADVARPLKRESVMEGYRDMERRIMAAVCLRFGLPLEQPLSVDRADMQALAVEARDQMSPLDPDWHSWIKDVWIPEAYTFRRGTRLGGRVEARDGWGWTTARSIFAHELERLSGESGIVVGLANRR